MSRLEYGIFDCDTHVYEPRDAFTRYLPEAYRDRTLSPVRMADGKEKITVGGQAREATKIIRTAGNKQTIVWVVPNMPVPARILQREDGQDSIDLQVKAWH